MPNRDQVPGIKALKKDFVQAMKQKEEYGISVQAYKERLKKLSDGSQQNDNDSLSPPTPPFTLSGFLK